MPTLISAALIVVAVIHLLPLSGVLGNARLAALYGLPITEPNLSILMRHRAVLLGLVGLLLLAAAFRPELQIAALLGGFASVLSYLGLVRSVGGCNAQLRRVFTADVVALVCLLVAAAALAAQCMGAA